MTPSLDYLHAANRQIAKVLEKVRPKLLETQGNIEHKLKEDKTAVTEMDTFVEAQLQKALAKFDPGVAFSGEESGVDFTKETFWLVDPIDGTEPFIRGIPFATNMIALIHQAEPIMGIVFNFSLGDYYLAIKGQGATCNGHPIHVSDRKPDRAWVSFSSSNELAGKSGFSDQLDQFVMSARRFGAVGFDCSMIANGGLDGRIVYYGKGKEWDFAPTTLLVQEAGGKVANIGSDKYNYRDPNHIAANPYVFDALKEFMERYTENA